VEFANGEYAISEVLSTIIRAQPPRRSRRANAFRVESSLAWRAVIADDHNLAIGKTLNTRSMV
jgi:hypothetical protein